MITSEEEFLNFLDTHDFHYERVEHPAVFTCAEAELHRPKVPAVSTKNLFLCDKKARRFFLVVTSCERTVKFEALAPQLGAAYLRFASEENLQRILGVTRGAVTMMGLANDGGHLVELWIEAETWKGETFLSHPLVNTATLVLSKSELERFFALTGHSLHIFEGA
jgi:Ala-tRNA(Pro) deacylase